MFRVSIHYKGQVIARTRILSEREAYAFANDIDNPIALISIERHHISCESDYDDGWRTVQTFEQSLAA